jgi:hypothetical protein
MIEPAKGGQHERNHEHHMDDMTFDFDEARAEMRDAIEAEDTEEIIRLFKETKRHLDEAHDIETQLHLKRLMGQWLIKLQELGLLVEPH